MKNPLKMIAKLLIKMMMVDKKKATSKNEVAFLFFKFKTIW